MTPRTNPKLSDVARAAGVSLATASRALSEPELVKAGTRERVREVATMLGYVPHGAARALATRRSRTIGAVFPPVDNPIFAAAALRATRARIERGVDGPELIGMDHDPAVFELLSRSGVPYELMWSLDH